MVDWSVFGIIASAFSSILSAIAVIIAISALKKQTIATRFEMFDSCFNRILNLEKELYLTYTDKTEDERENWDSLFFNSIEELSFLTNEKYLDDSKMINFFGPAIINWYEEIFEKHSSKESRNDTNVYPEMKKLYKKLKEKKRN